MGVEATRGINIASPDTVSNVPTSMFVDFIAVRFEQKELTHQLFFELLRVAL